MKFVLERVTEPEIEPIVLADMKKALKAFEETTGEEDDIEQQFFAAREWVEDYTGRALVDQTWKLTISNEVQEPIIYPSRLGCYFGNIAWSNTTEIMLQKSPILAITSFVSVDSSGAETTVDASTYELREADSKWPRIVPLGGARWAGSMFRITFRAGYSDQTGSPQDDMSVIPKRFMQAIKLYAQGLYDHNPDLLEAAKNVVKPERVELGMA